MKTSKKTALAAGALAAAALLAGWLWRAGRPVLRITDWETGEIYVQARVEEGSRLYFGWMHSLERIPWDEYYHVDGELHLVLDAITFPAFGAGIPEAKGERCYIEDGLIHMTGIGQVFEEFVWLNSHYATRDIVLDGELLASGSTLPEHRRLRLDIRRGPFYPGPSGQKQGFRCPFFEGVKK